MKFLLHSLLFLLICVSSRAATGDVIIDVIGASGRRVAVPVPKTNDYFIGFDGSGNVVAKPGGGGTWDEITGKPTFGTLATQNGTITDYLTIAAAASAYSPLAGSTSLTTLGTITTGTWEATAIADTYIASAATWNAKQAALVSGTNIKTINGNSLLGSGNLTITGGIGGSTGSVDNSVLRSDGTGGGTLQASSVLIDDNGIVSSIGTSGGFYARLATPVASSYYGISFDKDSINLNYTDSSENVLGGIISGPAVWPDGTDFEWKMPDSSGSLIADGGMLAIGLTFPSNGLNVLDNASDSTLSIAVGEDLSANETLTVLVNDASRIVALAGDLNVSSAATISGTNTGDQDLSNYVQTGDSPTFNEVTLTNGILKSPTSAIIYDFYDTVDSTAAPFIAVRLYDDQDPPVEIGSSLFGFRGAGNGSGAQIFQGSTNSFNFEGIGGANTATVSAATFSGSGANLTNLEAGDISTGTLGVPRGGTGATTLTANAVLLGNGTSALQTVAPSTTGNVLTSNGTTWTSESAFSRIKLVDYFVGEMLFYTRSVGTGASTTNLNLAPVSGRYACYLQTGTTTTGYGQIIERASGTLSGWSASTSSVDMAFGLLLANLSNGTETFTIRAGLETDNFGAVRDGAFFRYTHSVNSGNWQCVTRNASVETVTNTSTAPSTSVWQRFQILINSAGNSVSFLLNGSVVATHTTNIPASAGISLGIAKSAGTTNRVLYCSPLQWIQTPNTPW